MRGPMGKACLPSSAVLASSSASSSHSPAAATTREETCLRSSRDGFPCTEEGVERETRKRTLGGCVEEWNRPSNRANRRLALRLARGRGAALTQLESGSAVSGGCFFEFLLPRGAALFFRGSWAGARLSWEPPERGYDSGETFEADARLRPDGTLVLVRRG